jgi:hypothetical protein
MTTFPCPIKMSSWKKNVGKNHSTVVNALSLQLRWSFRNFVEAKESYSNFMSQHALSILEVS